MKHQIAAVALILLTSCATLPGQNQYDWQDVGHSSVIHYGKVIAVRQVNVTGQNTGVGAVTGMTAGAIGGSYVGSGGGSIGAMLAGMVIGGIAGGITEQAMANRHGIEYTIQLKNRSIITVVQNISASDTPLHRGEKCIVQESGSYQRVLPINSKTE